MSFLNFSLKNYASYIIETLEYSLAKNSVFITNSFLISI